MAFPKVFLSGEGVTFKIRHQPAFLSSSRIRGAKIRADGAREEAIKAVREGSRRGRNMIDPYGGLRRAGAAIADDRAMPKWRLQLDGNRMQSL
jgi:hypothetical protein